VHPLVLAIATVAVTHGTSILPIAVLVFVDNARKAMVSFARSLYLILITTLLLISFYCIVLLTTLFVSSCYWQPLPLDSPLSTPWAENITTFAEALNATIMPNYSRPLPKVIRTVDRCWCDFAGGIFEPFNVSHWERFSVQRLKDDLERQQKLDEPPVLGTESTEQASSATVVVTLDMPRTPAPAIPNRSKFIANSVDIWSLLLRPFNIKMNGLQHHIPPPSAQPSISQIPPSSDRADVTLSLGPRSKENLPFLRKEYDLRAFGLGIIVDLGWTR
jgi:hypothetical protein